MLPSLLKKKELNGSFDSKEPKESKVREKIDEIVTDGIGSSRKKYFRITNV